MVVIELKQLVGHIEVCMFWSYCAVSLTGLLVQGLAVVACLLHSVC